MQLAQPALFGRKAGCELLKDSCDAYAQKNPAQNYYCPAARKDGERRGLLVVCEVCGECLC